MYFKSIVQKSYLSIYLIKNHETIRYFKLELEFTPLRRSCNFFISLSSTFVRSGRYAMDLTACSVMCGIVMFWHCCDHGDGEIIMMVVIVMMW